MSEARRKCARGLCVGVVVVIVVYGISFVCQIPYVSGVRLVRTIGEREV